MSDARRSPTDSAGGAAGNGTAWQQRLMDDVYLLLAAGLITPTIIYIAWGLIELANVEPFTP